MVSVNCKGEGFTSLYTRYRKDDTCLCQRGNIMSAVFSIHNHAQRTVQQGLGVELGLLCDPVDLFLELVDLFLDLFQVGIGVGAVGSLYSELLKLERCSLGKSPSRLDRNAVLGVAGCRSGP